MVICQGSVLRFTNLIYHLWFANFFKNSFLVVKTIFDSTVWWISALNDKKQLKKNKMWLTCKSWNFWFPPLCWSTKKRSDKNIPQKNCLIFFWIKIYSFLLLSTVVIKGFFYSPPIQHNICLLIKIRLQRFHLPKDLWFFVLLSLLDAKNIYHKKVPITIWLLST